MIDMKVKALFAALAAGMALLACDPEWQDIVNEAIVEEISLDQAELSLKEGEEATLTATIKPDEAALVATVTWESSDAAVASVDGGKVSAIKEGEAVITAKAGSKQAQCKVVVTKKEEDKPEVPILPVPEAVDLGLSVKWASFNLGASKPEECGNYYAWGETEPKTEYTWATYKWGKTSFSKDGVSKYCDTVGKGNLDDLIVLLPEDDAAHVKLGGKWRMPSRDEMSDLIMQCNWTWTFKNEIWGFIVTGPSGKSIFLPAAGERVDTRTLWVGTAGKGEDCYGWYWSNLVYSPGNQNANHLNICYDWYSWRDDPRCNGYSIRPVSD